jgi:recombinational DNA repair protein RecR
VTVDRIVKPTVAIVPRPRSVEFDELKVKVITETNVQEVIEKMKTNQGQFLVYALDPMTFKNLAIGIEEIKRYIQQQKDIIIYYEKALTDENTTLPVGEN